MFFGAKSATAAYFSLDPKIRTSSQGETFDVKIKIDTEGEQTTSADVVLLFDQNILDVQDVTPGDFYPQNFKNISSGKIYVGGAVQNATEYKVGSGVLSTIIFRGKGGGTTVVRFDCTPGKTSDSNISKNDKDATDILDCTKLQNGTYTITGEGHPTFQPTCSPTPSGELPEAGAVSPSIFLLVAGSLLTILGVLFRL